VGLCLYLTMIRVLVAASVTFGVARSETWTELGIGGCRAAGGVYDKRRSEKALGDAECRRACEEDEACTATVFGAKDSRTICHLLGGGPYTHTDHRSNFTCFTRSLKCTVPPERDGYDLSACNSQQSERPTCRIECAPGYTGDPVIRCLRAGGYFSLDGCAELSAKWAMHGAGSCRSLGGPHPFVSVTAVSRTECQARCQEDARCQAITYHAGSTSCELAREAPPASHRGSATDPDSECWRLGPPSLPTGSSYRGVGMNHPTEGVDNEFDVVIVVVVMIGALLITASLAVTHMLRVRLLERVSNAEKVSPPSFLTRLLCGPCALYYWEGSNPASRYATSWCCWRPSAYVVPNASLPTALQLPSNSQTLVEAWDSRDKSPCRAKPKTRAASPDRPSSKGSCSTRASTPGSKSGPHAMPIGRETDLGSPATGRSSHPSARGQVRGEPPPLPPLTNLPMPPRR